MNQKEQKKIALDFIKQHTLAVLSTVTPDNKSESAVIEFSEKENLEIIFDTFETFRKYTNMRNNPNVSVVIGWDEDKTLQLEGKAVELESEEVEEYKKIHLVKLPKAIDIISQEGIRFFKIVPTWIRYLDASVQPWDTFEINFKE